MATYPSGVYSPASKSNGQTIAASFFNDPDGEITAVENALLNGIAHAVTFSSGVTVSSGGLTVSTGNVTLGQNLQVAGNSTFAGTVKFSSAVTFVVAPTLPPPDAVRLELAAALEIAAGTTTAVSWTVQNFVTNSSMHSTAVNPSQVAFQSTGVYQCVASITWRTNAGSSFVDIRMEDSSGGNISRTYMRPVNGNVGLVTTGLKRVDTVAAAPWARVVVITSPSTNGIDNELSHFSVVKL